MTTVDAFGYLAAAAVFLAFSMKTMLSLRLVAIASNIAFIAYGLAAHLMPILLLHGFLLPLNILRLIQIQRFARVAAKASAVAPGTERFDWMIAVGDRRRFADGARLFARGDRADRLFVIVDGHVRLPELGRTLGPGSMFGEIGLFAADGLRTASAVAEGAVTVSEISDRRVRELFFNNPRFAYELVRLITGRMAARLGEAEQLAQTPPVFPPRADAG